MVSEGTPIRDMILEQLKHIVVPVFRFEAGETKNG